MSLRAGRPALFKVPWTRREVPRATCQTSLVMSEPVNKSMGLRRLACVVLLLAPAVLGDIRVCLRNANTDASTFSGGQVVVSFAYTRNTITQGTRTYSNNNFGFSASATLGPGEQSCTLSLSTSTMGTGTYNALEASIGFKDNAQSPTLGQPSTWKVISAALIASGGTFSITSSGTYYVTPLSIGTSPPSSAAGNYFALVNDAPLTYSNVRTYWNTPPGCYTTFGGGPPSSEFKDFLGTDTDLGAYGLGYERYAATVPGLPPNDDTSICSKFGSNKDNCWEPAGASSGSSPTALSDSEATLAAASSSAIFFCYRLKAKDDYGAVTYSSLSYAAFGGGTCCTRPTKAPTVSTTAPSQSPTMGTVTPTSAPSQSPVGGAGTDAPTTAPSQSPTGGTITSTSAPSQSPVGGAGTDAPSTGAIPTDAPTAAPGASPSQSPVGGAGTGPPGVIGAPDISGKNASVHGGNEEGGNCDDWLWLLLPTALACCCWWWLIPALAILVTSVHRMVHRGDEENGRPRRGAGAAVGRTNAIASIGGVDSPLAAQSPISLGSSVSDAPTAAPGAAPTRRPQPPPGVSGGPAIRGNASVRRGNEEGGNCDDGLWLLLPAALTCCCCLWLIPALAILVTSEHRGDEEGGKNCDDWLWLLLPVALACCFLWLITALAILVNHKRKTESKMKKKPEAEQAAAMQNSRNYRLTPPSRGSNFQELVELEPIRTHTNPARASFSGEGNVDLVIERGIPRGLEIDAPRPPHRNARDIVAESPTTKDTVALLAPAGDGLDVESEDTIAPTLVRDDTAADLEAGVDPATVAAFDTEEPSAIEDCQARGEPTPPIDVMALVRHTAAPAPLRGRPFEPVAVKLPATRRRKARVADRAARGFDAQRL